uniref:Bowman-Birk serine protease inhibitors family domain-containing protein n=1 Tax=Oryza barthii TaxID=65489 RepID=A0A0D3HJ11_9ORYZ
MSPPSARKILAVVASSVTMAQLAMAATGQPLPGRCDDLGLPGPCTAGECRGMGGDSTRASCNNAGKCCCPARNALVCERYDHCRDRIDGCRKKCEDDWALSPAGAYCKDGSGNVRDSCCCRPNATVAVDDDVDHHRRIHLHQLDLRR